MPANNQQETEGATMEKILEQQARTDQRLVDHIEHEEGTLDKIQADTSSLIREVHKLKATMEMIPPREHMADHFAMRALANKANAEAERALRRADWWEEQRDKLKTAKWLAATGMLVTIGWYVFTEWLEYKTGIHLPRKVN